MRAKLFAFAIVVGTGTLSTSYGALYTVTTGTTATSNGIASTSGLVSDPVAAPQAGVFTGYQSPGNSGIVAIGIFSTLSDVQITGAADLSSLVSGFNIFGVAGTFNAGGPTGQKGVFSLDSGAVTVNASIFDTKNIYVFVGNGTTFANSTELLVLKNSTLFAAAQDAIPTPLTVIINTGTTSLLFGRSLADVRTTTADASETLGWGTAIAIPEPSTALLGAVGALVLLRRRRI